MPEEFSTTAFPSKLGSRPSRPVPLASQTYIPHVKVVLRHRLYHDVFVHSFFSSVVLAYLLYATSRGGFDHAGVIRTLFGWVYPLFWIWPIVYWLAGVAPIVIVRKFYLSGTPSPASSPSKRFHSAISKPSALRALQAYIVSAVLLFAAHTIMHYWNRSSGMPDPRLWIFVKSRKHPYYINGRFIFLLLSQVTLACLAALRTIMLDRFAVRRHLGKKPVLAEFFEFFVPSGVAIVGLAIASVIFCEITFVIARLLILPVISKIPIINQILRPFIAHWLRGSSTFILYLKQWDIIIMSGRLGITTMYGWELAEWFFDRSVAEPVRAAPSASDPTLAMVSGVACPDPYFKYLAYWEFEEFLEGGHTSRGKLIDFFGDQRFTPTLWGTVCRETLLQLGRDYQLLLRRGAPAPEVPAPPAAAAPPPKDPDPTASILIKQPIYKPAVPTPSFRSFAESLASDSPLSQAADSSASQLPELFRSVVPPVAVVEKVEERQRKVMAAVAEWVRPGKWREVGVALVVAVWKKYRPVWVEPMVGRLTTWWEKERPSRAAEVSLPNRELDVCAIIVLSELLCQSMEHDELGLVQKDIPKVLEALMTFRKAIKQYKAELKTQRTPQPGSDRNSPEYIAWKELSWELDEAEKTVGFVGLYLKEAIRLILRRFGNSLGAYTFPPRVAVELQRYADKYVQDASAFD